MHLHESFNGFWLDENGNRVKLCLLQPLDGVARHVQDAVLPLAGHKRGPASFSHTYLWLSLSESSLEQEDEGWNMPNPSVGPQLGQVAAPRRRDGGFFSTFRTLFTNQQWALSCSEHRAFLLFYPLRRTLASVLVKIKQALVLLMVALVARWLRRPEFCRTPAWGGWVGLAAEHWAVWGSGTRPHGLAGIPVQLALAAHTVT